MAQLGIDLSGDSIALAEVREVRGRLQLRGFALFDPIPDRTALTETLRRAREDHRFPPNAEVVAWAGEPRVSAVRAAGYGIERVVLPGEALERVARLHRGLEPESSSRAITAILSLDATSGTVAIVRDATVLYEAPLTWSSGAAPGSPNAKGAGLLPRYAFLFELTEQLHGAWATLQQTHQVRPSTILTCGSVPELRSLIGPLAEEFHVEVHPLDSADPFDLRRLKGHQREEAERHIAALQLAIVASRRWHRSRSRVNLLKIAVPIGLAATAYGIYAGRSSTSFDSPGPQGSPSSQGSPGSADARIPRTPVGSVPGGLPGAPPPPLPPSSKDLRPLGPFQSEAAPPPATTADARMGGSQEGLRNDRNPGNGTSPVSLSLTSILYSRERQLAIIEGQVLGVGDTVAGMTIVEIGPNSVILRDRAGRLRRAVLRDPEPEPSGH